MKQQRYFLQLFAQTNFTQRKALLDTVTQSQIKALSEIAHNFVRGILTFTPAEQTQLKRHRRFIHLLGDKHLGYKHKRTLVRNKPRILYLIVKKAVTYLEQLWQ